MPQNQATNIGFAYGVQVHLPNQDMSGVVSSATGLGVTWVKQQIDWSLYEPTQGSINWAPIDEMVDALDASGVNILLTVSSARSARDKNEEKVLLPITTPSRALSVSSPSDMRGVDAYEIWNEPICGANGTRTTASARRVMWNAAARVHCHQTVRSARGCGDRRSCSDRLQRRRQCQ
jgi:hypothetical protein